MFGAEYNLSNLDLLETIGTGTFGRGKPCFLLIYQCVYMRLAITTSVSIVRIVKDIKSRIFYALKIMKKARIVRLKQIGKKHYLQ